MCIWFLCIRFFRNLWNTWNKSSINLGNTWNKIFVNLWNNWNNFFNSMFFILDIAMKLQSGSENGAMGPVGAQQEAELFSKRLKARSLMSFLKCWWDLNLINPNQGLRASFEKFFSRNVEGLKMGTFSKNVWFLGS